jgi:hypothetical protein
MLYLIHKCDQGVFLGLEAQRYPFSKSSFLNNAKKMAGGVEIPFSLIERSSSPCVICGALDIERSPLGWDVRFFILKRQAMLSNLSHVCIVGTGNHTTVACHLQNTRRSVILFVTNRAFIDLLGSSN